MLSEKEFKHKSITMNYFIAYNALPYLKVACAKYGDTEILKDFIRDVDLSLDYAFYSLNAEDSFNLMCRYPMGEERKKAEEVYKVFKERRDNVKYELMRHRDKFKKIKQFKLW